MTKEEESKLSKSLQVMEGDLYKAMRFSRAFRTLVEREAAKDPKKIRESLGEFLT